MRLGNPCLEKYTTRERQGARKEVVRWRVRWRAYPPGGESRSCKRSGFERKGEAETYAENVRRAELRAAGWAPDSRGYPAQASAVATGEAGETIVQALRTYIRRNWRATWNSPRTREKVRGRLIRFAVLASTFSPETVEEVFAVLDERRSKNRPEPVTPEEWLGRYLREYALMPDEETRLAGVPAEIREARAWLEGASFVLTSVTDEELLRSHEYLVDGRPHGTARAYWAVIQSFFTWALQSRRIEWNPIWAIGKVRRDLRSEKVDPERVPSEEEIWAVAREMGRRFGDWALCLVVVMAYAALRIGEVAGLRVRSVAFLPSGGVRLRLRSQDRRQTRAYSDDGDTTIEEAPLKGRLAGPASFKPVYLRADAAELLRPLVAGKKPSDRVFTAARGGPVDPNYWRRTYWIPVIADLFGPDHRLSGITPHALRHAGMTMWLRAGVPLKIVQRWGGWESLKDMLDVYVGVLPDDEQRAVDAVEAAASGERPAA